MSEDGSGRGVEKPSFSSAECCLALAPAAPDAHGERQFGDVYCFKLSPLLSSPCQEVFEDRKYSGDFVSGVHRNLKVAREFQAHFHVPSLVGVPPG